MNKSFSIMWNKAKLALRSWEVQYASVIVKLFELRALKYLFSAVLFLSLAKRPSINAYLYAIP